MSYVTTWYNSWIVALVLKTIIVQKVLSIFTTNIKMKGRYIEFIIYASKYILITNLILNYNFTFQNSYVGYVDGLLSINLYITFLKGPMPIFSNVLIKIFYLKECFLQVAYRETPFFSKSVNSFKYLFVCIVWNHNTSWFLKTLHFYHFWHLNFLNNGIHFLFHDPNHNIFLRMVITIHLRIWFQTSCIYLVTCIYIYY